MTDKTLRTLASGVTPQDNDLFLTRQGTDTADRKVTFAQIKATAIENLFNVTTDTLDDIDPGTTNKQFTATEKAKLDSIGTGANVISVNGETGVVVLDKADIGLGNVDNTSDANKPISTAQQTALNLKANLASPTFTGTVSGITKTMVGLSNVDNTSDASKPVSTAQQSALDLKANLASPTFTGTVSGITKTMVGLGNVDNTSDANKPISTATQTALNLKYDASNPSSYVNAAGASAAAPVQSVAGKTGAVTLVKADVGLANVDNTADANKPISSATQTALDLKYNASNPSDFISKTEAYNAFLFPTYKLDMAAYDTIDSRLTTVRSGNAWYFDNTGTLQVAATNTGRIGFDPSTLNKMGFMFEPTRKNVVEKSAYFTGLSTGNVVVGTSIPSTWVLPGSISGTSRTVMGFGTEHGMPYVDIRFNGTTPASGNLATKIGFTNSAGSTENAAAVNDVWAGSFYYKVVGGSSANIQNIRCNVEESNSSHSYLASSGVSSTNLTTNALVRVKNAKLFGNASVAFANILFELWCLSYNTAFDITLRLYQPQLEKCNADGIWDASSPIPTTAGGVTRNAEYHPFASRDWYDASKGTFLMTLIPMGSLGTLPSGANYLADGTTGVSLFKTQSSGHLGINDGTNNIDLGLTLTPNAAVHKILTAYGAGTALSAIDGTAGSLVACNTNINTTSLRLGLDGLGAGPSFGYLQKLEYFPVKVSSGVAASLTV